MPPTMLVTGFGPFLTVQDNPSARLARALDGLSAGPWRLVGRVIEVSYRAVPSAVVAAAVELGADTVVGFGVSRTGGLRVECVGRARLGDSPDVCGARPERLPGPAEVRSTLDHARLAEALACPQSADAGAYVCNAWLHQVTQALEVPVGFVHIPPEGVSPERVRNALAQLARP